MYFTKQNAHGNCWSIFCCNKSQFKNSNGIDLFYTLIFPLSAICIPLSQISRENISSLGNLKKETMDEKKMLKKNAGKYKAVKKYTKLKNEKYVLKICISKAHSGGNHFFKYNFWGLAKCNIAVFCNIA